MKKILCLVAFIAAVGLANAQKEVKDITDVEFYGADFSHAKVVGMTNGPTEIRNGLNNINYLFISEAKKFDVSKFFGKNAKTSIDMIADVNSEVEAKDIVGTDASYSLPATDIPDIIKSYKVEGEGTGLIFIASLLDKGKVNGSYYVVFFDKATKNVLYSQLANGEPKGFGVRNYWAGSIFEIMKEWKSKHRK